MSSSDAQMWNAMHEVLVELRRARSIHPPMHSAHEGYATIKEEVEELWDEIKKKQPDPEAMRKEAIQVAAMGVRFILDVCDNAVRESSPPQHI